MPKGIARTTPRKCVICGREFWFAASSLRRTCSPACQFEQRSRAKRGTAQPHEAMRIARETRLAMLAEREPTILPPRTATCARPGCQNKLTGQATKYCSPRCHYADRSRAGTSRRDQRYHRCQACGNVFLWNGKGRGVFCSRPCKDADSGNRVHVVEVVEVVQIRGHRRVDFLDPSEACRACGRPAQHVHHVVLRQHIERLKGDRWHPDDALALCTACHAQAHGLRRLPVAVLRPENLAFAVDLLGAYAVDYLRRYYVDDGDPRLTAMESAYDLARRIEVAEREEAGAWTP